MAGGFPAVARRACAELKSSMVVGAEITGTVGAVQLFFDDAFPGGLAGAGGARHAKYQCVVGGAREGVGLKGGTADFKEGQMPEQLADAGDALKEKRVQGGSSQRDVRQ